MIVLEAASELVLISLWIIFTLPASPISYGNTFHNDSLMYEKSDFFCCLWTYHLLTSLDTFPPWAPSHSYTKRKKYSTPMGYNILSRNWSLPAHCAQGVQVGKRMFWAQVLHKCMKKEGTQFGTHAQQLPCIEKWRRLSCAVFCHRWQQGSGQRCLSVPRTANTFQWKQSMFLTD